MKAKRIRCMCGNRFTPKRSNQLHCSPECRKASYERGDKAAVRRQRYNTGSGRQTVQSAYNRSEKGAVRRDRWQRSRAGRAWRKAWYAPERVAAREAAHAARRKTTEEAWEAETRERMKKLAEENGVSVSEAVRNYLDTGWRGVPLEKYLKQWLSELRQAA